MNQNALHVTLINPDQGREVMRATVLPYIGKLIEAGKRVVLTAMEGEDERSLRQLAFYWGPCLKDISEQASVGGVKYSKDAWHELFKREHLPRRQTKAVVAGRARPVYTTSIGSTKGLSVSKMSKYLDKVQAFAATDLGVVFSLQNWESYK